MGSLVGVKDAQSQQSLVRFEKSRDNSSLNIIHLQFGFKRWRETAIRHIQMPRESGQRICREGLASRE